MIDHNERAAEARALRQAAADARSMHDPLASDCEEWAAWLEARAERIEHPGIDSTATPPDSPEANHRARVEGQTITLEPMQPLTPEQRQERMCGCTLEPVLPPAEPVSIADMAPGTHAYIEGRFGDDGVCHAHTPGQTNYSAWPGRCYRPRADRVHFDPSTIRDVTPPAATPGEG